MKRTDFHRTPSATRSAAKDFERAAGLIELAWSAMDVSYQSSIWLGWVKALPEVLIQSRPVLSVGYAWALLDGGELEASESRLQDAEGWLDTPTEQMVVLDEAQFRSLPATIATARAYRCLALGDIHGTVKYAQQALELTPEDDQVRHIQATSLLGLAQYANGNLEAAERSLADFLTNLRNIGEIPTLIGITFLLADIRVALGRLREAESSYQQALRLVRGMGEPAPLGTADLHRGLAVLYVEWGDLEAAAQHLLTGQKLGELSATTNWPHRLCVSKARLEVAQGDLDAALALLDEAEDVYVRGPLPEVRPVPALKARTWVGLGRLAEALSWARERNLSPDDDLSYMREFEHLTLARVLIARYKSDRVDGDLHAALELLERVLQAAEEGGRNGSVIEILILQSLTYQAQGNQPGALASLGRALALAEPEGYIRTFVDEGNAMELLLQGLKVEDGRIKEYAGKLLVAFGQQSIAADLHPSALNPQPLIDPLSEREMEVLKLLRSDLSGPEIAQQLVVSLNTLRTHTKNIYNKLGVNSRRAAIRRAEELDIF